MSDTKQAIGISFKLMSDTMEEMIKTTKWDSKVQSLENNIALVRV